MQNKNSSRWKRMWIAVIGGTVLIFGIVLIVLPGPAFIVIPAGLTILATEFAWANHWLQKIHRLIDKTKARLKKRKSQ